MHIIKNLREFHTNEVLLTACVHILDSYNKHELKRKILNKNNTVNSLYSIYIYTSYKEAQARSPKDKKQLQNFLDKTFDKNKQRRLKKRLENNLTTINYIKEVINLIEQIHIISNYQSSDFTEDLAKNILNT